MNGASGTGQFEVDRKSGFPYATAVEIGVYALAVLFAANRIAKAGLPSELDDMVDSPKIRRTTTIAAEPEAITPHLEQLKLRKIDAELKRAPEGRGTELTLIGGGRAGPGAGEYANEDEIRKLLRSIKMIVETGEVATVSGQTHGVPVKVSLTSQLGSVVHKIVHRRDINNATEGQCKRFAGTESTN
ncbi:MAG: hypothetical protein V4692_16170 [Bdellovibrionota bacterium]